MHDLWLPPYVHVHAFQHVSFLPTCLQLNFWIALRLEKNISNENRSVFFLNFALLMLLLSVFDLSSGKYRPLIVERNKPINLQIVSAVQHSWKLVSQDWEAEWGDRWTHSIPLVHRSVPRCCPHVTFLYLSLFNLNKVLLCTMGQIGHVLCQYNLQKCRMLDRWRHDVCVAWKMPREFSANYGYYQWDWHG